MKRRLLIFTYVRKGAITHQDSLGKTRHGYLVPAKGSVEVNGVTLNARDGAGRSARSRWCRCAR
jgi:redox-sensitive bicupin YhaK (pirin superfamily)